MFFASFDSFDAFIHKLNQYKYHWTTLKLRMPVKKAVFYVINNLRRFVF
jgi:hypothetical protein